MMGKYKQGDKVVIIDHANQGLWWDKAEVTDYYDDSQIILYVPTKKIRVKVTADQIMDYDLMREFSEMVGAGPNDFTEWDLSDIQNHGSRDMPPEITDDMLEECTCDMTELMRYGCRCENGRKQLERENAE